MTIALPVGQTDITLCGDLGVYFLTGIAYLITGQPADSDNTPLVAGDINSFNIVYA
jgi:hypothetical protein